MEHLCIFCRNLDWEEGEPGWSELTPGWDAKMGCKKNKWEDRSVNINFLTLEEFRELILTAKTCDKFTVVK